ncbi:hypothetical protein [Vibrio cincinnatiensis]|uniref:hypothetical protein n=1 Tax=Vibrio cincinnatiensis TaxID=675 RepID=UPI001EDFE4A2|nr:hypothetical protein [Vibrio cincinnatiensis]MCG3741184.1 hypothetical protein [Vibrio cincinnatiensis]
MAQQNSPQTRSNPNQATSVSTLDHESSPKNDISKSHASNPDDCFLWNNKALDLSIHTEAFVSCDGNPFDEDDKRTNWRVCAWEESVNGDEHSGSVVLHYCKDAEEARVIAQRANVSIFKQKLPLVF